MEINKKRDTRKYLFLRSRMGLRFVEFTRPFDRREKTYDPGGGGTAQKWR